MWDKVVEGKKLTVVLPAGLHRKVKIAAAHSGQSMREFVQRGLEAVLEGRA